MTPRAAPTRCTQGCGQLATHKGRCEQHQRKAWENTSKRNQLLDRNEWRRAQAEHLSIEPACRACGSTQNLEVDHVLPVADGGALYDHSNLQTLCGDHHEAKSRQERTRRRQEYTDD